MTKAIFTRNNHFDNINLNGRNIGALTEQPMTYKNTLQKVSILFGVMIAMAAVSWAVMPPFMIWVFLVGGLVLGLVNSFKKEPSPGLITLYAVAQGGLLGTISKFYELIWPGIVIQAVLATLAVCAAVLMIFTFGKVRATPKLNKFFMVALVSYLLYGVINIILVWTGVVNTPFGINGLEWNGIPIGLLIGAFAVLLASYSLIQDFTYIEAAVQNQAPSKQGWYAGFGLMVTIVWMYLEILRLLAIARR